ncbi:MAG: hypothetical protein U0271_04015 [Polyangiaceae bacterium]
MFASRTFKTVELDRAKQCYGSNIYVGFDGLCAHESCAFAADLAAGAIRSGPLVYAKAQGFHLHAYVEGPGGETSGDLSEDEGQRVVAASNQISPDAVKTCLETHFKGKSYRPMTRYEVEKISDEGASPGEETLMWLRCGWKVHTFAQLCRLKAMGFETAEIDNLENSFPSAARSAVEMKRFLDEYAAHRCSTDSGAKDEPLPDLVLKNLSVEEWQLVVPIADQLPLASFAIDEASEDEVRDRQQLASRAGITLLRGPNTDDYYAWGPRRTPCDAPADQ